MEDYISISDYFKVNGIKVSPNAFKKDVVHSGLKGFILEEYDTMTFLSSMPKHIKEYFDVITEHENRLKELLKTNPMQFLTDKQNKKIIGEMNKYKWPKLNEDRD